MQPSEETLTGWGGGPRVRASLLRARSVEQLREALTGRQLGAIARGMGRSYGDAAQLRSGLVLGLAGLDGYELDQRGGLLRVGGGVTLGELLEPLARAGWTLPVVPGTQHVTIGGAIACDIHGKNHAAVGSFSAHLRSLALLTSAGEVVELGPEPEHPPEHARLLDATVGGLGLTGAIVSAELQLTRLPPQPMLSVDTQRVRTLDGALASLTGSSAEHRVAWLDLLHPAGVRGAVTGARLVAGPPARNGDRGCAMTVRSRVRVPARWQRAVLSPSLVRVHNEHRYRRTPRLRRGALDQFGPHMFPLDAIGSWPRLYGPSGLVQYQFVVPRGHEQALERVISLVRASQGPVLPRRPQGARRGQRCAAVVSVARLHARARLPAEGLRAVAAAGRLRRGRRGGRRARVPRQGRTAGA